MRSVFLFATLVCIGVTAVQGYGLIRSGPSQKFQGPINNNVAPQHIPPKIASGPNPHGPPGLPPPSPHGPPSSGPHETSPLGPHGPPPPSEHHVVQQLRVARRPHPPEPSIEDSSDSNDDSDDNDDDSFDRSGPNDDNSSPSDSDDDNDYYGDDDDDRPGRFGHHGPPGHKKPPGHSHHKRPGWKDDKRDPWNHHRPHHWDSDYSSRDSSDYPHHHKPPCRRCTKRPPKTKPTRATPSSTKRTPYTPPYTRSTRVTRTPSTRFTPPYTRSTRVTPTPSTHFTPSYTKSTPVTIPSTRSTAFTPPYTESFPSTRDPGSTPTFTESTIAPDVVKTTVSPETQRCIDACPSTNEYNPVCGTNGETYRNQGKLRCAIHCGVVVQLRRTSACPKPDPNIATTLTSTVTETVTNTPPIGRTTPSNSFKSCMSQCPITGTFQPVCGTDIETYLNMDRLKCAQRCGEVVNVLCEKACAACGYSRVPTTPTETTTFTTTSDNIWKSTQAPDIEECIKACPTTSENNPVCGTDKVTYKNPSQLLCAQMCGVSVNVARFSPCSTTSTTSTTTQLPIPDIPTCIKACPRTSEYNPVCGSNGLMYKNIGELDCAKYCGIEVKLRPNSNCDTSLFPTPSTTTIAINGSKDEVTTSSRTTEMTTANWIATPDSTPRPFRTTRSPGSSTTSGFSIPQDVIDIIFHSTTVRPPVSSKTPNPDSDEDLDIDQRFKNDNEAHKGRHPRIIFPE